MAQKKREAITLKDLLLSVVRELDEAERERSLDRTHQARLGVERVELELKVQVSHKGKGGVFLFNIVEVGYEGAKESISTLKVSLVPLSSLLPGEGGGSRGARIGRLIAVGTADGGPYKLKESPAPT